MRAWLALLAGLACWGEPVALRFVVSEWANLTFELDAMAGLSPADGEAYRALWRRELRWDREDDRQLDRWKGYRQRLLAAPPDSGGEKVGWPPNYPAFYGGELGVDGAARIAGLQARSVEDYRKRVLRVAGKPVADGLTSVLRHFGPRFGEFWAREGRGLVADKAERFRVLVRERKIGELADRLAVFTEARLGRKREAWFYLMAHPTRFGTRTMATMVGNHAPVELLDGETPEERVGVIVHELVHHLYDTAARERQLGLIAEFRRLGGGWRMPAYSYLNEALATAAQGLAEGRRAVYSQPWIEALGAATAPVLKACLGGGCGLFTGFAERYLAAVEGTLGERIGHPHFRLASRVVVLGDDRLRRAARLFREGVPAIMHTSGWEGVARFPEVPVVVLALVGEEKGMLARIGESRETVVLTGATVEEVERAVERFARLAF